VRFWSSWGKAFSTNIQTSGRKTIGFSTMSMRLLTHHSLFDNSWLPKTLQWFLTPLFAWPCPLQHFPVSQDEITAERVLFWYTWRDPCRNARGYRHTFDNFQGCMKSWETHWDRCVLAQGHHYEETETRSYGKKLFLWSDSPNFWVDPRVPLTPSLLYIHLQHELTVH
jgi:hypothetical protein